MPAIDIPAMIREQAESMNRVYQAAHDAGYAEGLRACTNSVEYNRLLKENDQLRDEIFRLRQRIAELASLEVAP